MIDAEKKDTLCIFITPSERVEKNDDGENIYRFCLGNAKKYFENFCTHGVLPLEYADKLINMFGIKAINDNDVKNVQVIFDIHGNKEGLSISEEEMHKILGPILASLKNKKIEIMMANCQGNLKFKKNNGHESLPKYLKEMAEKHYVKPENISLYCMPEGHNANITFTKNGDIFFISNNAEKVNYNQDNSTERFYKNQNDQEPGLVAVNEGGCWSIPAEKYCKGGETNILEGIYKGRPLIQIDINTGKPFSNALVLYKPSLFLRKWPGRWQNIIKVTKKIKENEPSISGQTNKQGRLQNFKVTKKQKPDNHEPSINTQELIDKLLKEF